jgi:serine/threonine protein kinase
VEWNPQANELFVEALARPEGPIREAFLNQACGNDDALKGQVLALLEGNQKAGQFLSLPAEELLQKTVDFAQTEKLGTVIGPYKLLQEIGAGGFGVVYMAEQQRPVRRKVALKVIKPGMDTRQVVARFEAERQALAIMDHPNIAKVHDGGVTASGRPYFVMELVKGVPITEFCDAKQLTPRERLELFVPVCQAVQHAHNKGIVHRDLKPTNVLVTVHDTTPVVKVIDFGVAKALGQELTEKTLYTGFAEMVGTPLYMSPEQAGQSGLDIDTRSDIYSLGVLLYELLTGTTPFTKERFKKAAYDEIIRIIRAEEPPKPSTRLSESQDSLPSISAQRHTEPAKLTKLVRGELDWIVMKALEKERTRRYETVSGLAMDVQRYLADEPVLACPPSATYRLRKFARRYRVPLAVAASFLLLLVTATVVSTYQAIRIRAEQQNTLAQKLEADRQRERAERALALSVTSNYALAHWSEFIRQYPNLPMFWSNRGEVHQQLNQMDKALEDYTEAIRLAPEEAIYLIHRGGAYAALGEWEKAAADFDRSLELEPRRFDARYLSACTHLATGDLQGYRRICGELVQGFFPTLDPMTAERLAKTCTLAPNSVPDFSPVEKLAQFIVTGTEEDVHYRGFMLTKGLTEFRAGRHDQAVDWLTRMAPTADGLHFEASAFAALAMAQHGLGQSDEAVRSLDKAKALMAQKMPDPKKGRPFHPRDWYDWLHAQILCREAAELLGTKNPTQPKPPTTDRRE